MQFDTFDKSTFDWNLGLHRSPLSKKCGNTLELPLIETNNEEEGPNVMDWDIRALGFVGGFTAGCAIGINITDEKHEWFVEAFGRI